MKNGTRYKLMKEQEALARELKSNYQEAESIQNLDALNAYWLGKRHAFEVMEKHFEQMAKIFEYENFDIVDAN